MIEAFIAGCVLGLCGSAGVLWLRRAPASAPARIPSRWPLSQRLLVNTRERKIWQWLRTAMADHQVMVKLPVTRFTIPAQPAKPQEAEHWYAMLNRVYCSFTVCTPDGRVLGCVDVAARAGMTLSHQQMKHSLLSQCGIPYWVVEPDKLPAGQEIRAAFLGHTPASDERARLDIEIQDAADSLQATVSRQRSDKGKAAKPAAPVLEAPPVLPDVDHWEQNSFIAPMDSRVSDL